MQETKGGAVPPENPEEDSRTQAERAEFEAALAAGDASRSKFEEGQLVSGTIAGIQDDALLVSFGGKSEVILPKTEGDEGLEIGQTIEAVVVSVRPELRLSRGMAAERRSAAELRDAYEARIAVEGKVLARNKGGFHVSIGKVGAFCPASQMDLSRSADPNQFLEKTFPFRIIEYAEGGRRIVVSRVALLREEKERKAAETMGRLAVGTELDGTVTSVMDYGAFVDLGGIEGLVHVSEMSRRRVNNPREVVAPGQAVRVRITKIEGEGKRISLSMKDLEKDPWAEIAQRFAAGATFSGTILRKADFGFFVELEPGIDGLLHNSQLPPGLSKDDPSLAPGQSITGWVREIDTERRRLSLALREVASGDPWADVDAKYREGSVVEGQVERVAPFGAFVALEPGLTGLVPMSESGLPHGADASKAFSPGQKLVVKVLSVDRAKKRISLSVTGAKDEIARGEYREYVEKSNASASGEGGGMTAFAAAFAKMKDKKK